MAQTKPEVTLETVLKLVKEATGKEHPEAVESTLVADLFPNTNRSDDFLSEGWLNFVEFIMSLEDAFDIGDINEAVAEEIRSQTIGQLLNRIQAQVTTST